MAPDVIAPPKGRIVLDNSPVSFELSSPSLPKNPPFVFPDLAFVPELLVFFILPNLDLSINDSSYFPGILEIPPDTPLIYSSIDAP